MEFLSFGGAAGIYVVVAIYILCIASVGYKLYLHATEDRPMRVAFETIYISSFMAYSLF